jgi:hypothetical protein
LIGSIRQKDIRDEVLYRLRFDGFATGNTRFA